MMKRILCTYFILLLFNFFAYSQIPVEHLQLWLSADSVEIVSGKVARWYDLSPNSYVISQGTDVNRPSKIDNSLNNEPVISFNGTTTYLDGGDILNLSTNSNMIFFIAKGSRAVLSKSKAADAANRYSFILGTNNFQTIYQDNILRNFSYTNASFNNQKYNLFTIANNRALNRNKYYINSDSIGQSTILGSQNFTSSYNFLIGAYNNSTGGVPPLTNATYGYLNGSIAEIIIIDTVSSQLKTEIENYLFDKYSPCFSLQENLQIDYGFCDTTLSVEGGFYDYLWSTGETTNSIQVNQTGVYTVMAKDNLFGRFCYDTVNVQFPELSVADSFVCLFDSLLCESNLGNDYNYLWSDLSTESSVWVKDPGSYWLEATDSVGCSYKKHFDITIDSFPSKIWLGNDTSLCSGNSIRLIEGEQLCTTFYWTPGGNTGPNQIVTENGWQKLETTNNNNCNAIDSIYVTVVGSAPTPDYTVENICFGDTTLFIDNSTPSADISSWKWIININDTIYTQNAGWQFLSPGTQEIKLFVESMSGCSSSIDFQTEIFDVPDVSFSYSSVCVGTPMHFQSEILIPEENTVVSSNWILNGSVVGNMENLDYSFGNTGLFGLEFEVYISNGCADSYSDSISVLDSYPLAGDFTLISPLDNYYYGQEELKFQWNNSADATSYIFIFSTDQDFNENIFLQEQDLNEAEITLPLHYSYDTIYWKVQAINPCGTVTSSDIRKILSFDYSKVANVALWLSADSVEAVDNKVSQWYDLSPNTYPLLQTSDNFKPLQTENVINNKPVISFDGIDDYLDGGNILNLGTKSHTILFIANGQKTIFAKSRASGDPNRYALLLNLNRMENLYHDNLLRSYVYNDISFSNASYNFYKIVNQRTDNKNLYFLNNSLLGAATINGAYNMSSEYNFLIGAYNNSSGGVPPLSGSTYGYLNGSIAELIFIDSLVTDSDYNLICNYLRDKYSQSVNLSYDIRVPYGFCDTAITTAYKPWFTEYEWSTGETDSVIHVNRPGIYTVTVTDIFGFTSSDDIRVFYPEVNDFSDTIVCYGASVVWDTELEGDYGYEWYGSSELTRAITITDEGHYAAILTDTLGCKYYSDTISFSFDNYEFTASVGPADTALCSGNRLMLITNAGETVSYNWSIGSTNPEIVLTESGTYYVTVNNWRGCEATDNINVTITGQVPFPAFSSLGHCARNAVSFTDESTTPDGIINNWTWRINGNIVSTQQNPEYTFTEPGTYNVNLSIVTDNDCGDFVTIPVIIYPLPIVSFEPEYFCQNAETEFISTSTVSESSVIYNLWNFDSYAISGTPVNYSFTNEGYHNIKLISSSEMSCTDSLTREVFVRPAEQPVYTAGNTCLGEDVYFINTTPYNPVNPGESWSWDFGDGGSSSLSNPQHAYSGAGTFNTVLNIQYSNKCIVSTSLPVEVYFNPEATLYQVDACEGVVFSPESDVSTLSGNIISYSWNIETETPLTSVLQNPGFIIADTGSYNMSLSVLTDFGCRTTQTNTVNIHESPLAEFSASRTWGSVPLWIDFTNTGENAETYFWDFGDDEISTEENPYHIFADSGTYNVRLISTSAFGCRDSAEMKIKSIIPVMDVILYNLRTVMNGNYLQTQVYVINNGTLPVNNLEMVLNLGNEKIYREVIEYLAPSQVIDYRFTLEAYIPGGNLPDVVCVEAVAPAYEGNTDSDLSNNIVCNTDVENLKVMQPYPNPATEQLTCEFIVAQNQDITITLVNNIGEVVYKNILSDKEGYTKLTINVKDFVQGVYFMQVTDGTEKQSYKIEIQ